MVNPYSQIEQLFMSEHSNFSILIVDDEELVRWSLQHDLAKAGYQVYSTSSGEEAISILQNHEPEITLLDVQLPGMNGFEVLSAIQNHNISTLVMMLTVVTELPVAVKAIRAGAIDYITKPFELNDVLLRIENAIQQNGMKRELNRLRSRQTQSSALEDIIAVSPKTQQVLETAAQIAESGNSTVLVRGESGVGKDIISGAIHNLSPRSKAAFIEVNCPSFPSQLLENELFGHERGAFTDARASKEGLVELAHKGTLFLNEISDVDLNIQAKLLQFLEKKTFRRIGSTKERHVDVRVIAATNQNMEQFVKEGKFRQDLFYRLNVIPLYIPPLRERHEDVPALIEHFLEKFRREFFKPHLEVAQDVMESLTAYHWPGNVRELKNCLERMVLLSKNHLINKEVVPIEIKESYQQNNRVHSAIPAAASPIVMNEIKMIEQALKDAEGNQSRAARHLKISRDTLRYRMKKYGIHTLE